MDRLTQFAPFLSAALAVPVRVNVCIVSSRRTLSDSPVRGFDYDYAYDPIGNRASATDYDEQGNPLLSTYSANALNQYTQRTVPGYATVRGEVLTNATITVNERPTFRQGAFFYGGDEADNTTSNLWKNLEIYAAINPPGTNTPDTVYAETNRVFVAKTPELFTYDADGNMTSDGRFHYHWNGENRLVMASNSEVVVTYAYDHRGRMISKTLCASAPLRLNKNTTYIWDDWNIIREVVREGDSVAVTDNVWGLDLDGTLQGAGGVGGLLAVLRSDCVVTNSSLVTRHSSLYLPTYDANGNISEYVSTNGEVVAHYDYSPFGEPLVASGPLVSSFTHQFSTKPYCPVTGFSEYQMRKYRPTIGRWMSREPFLEKKEIAAYCFCNNSPKNARDMIGLYTRKTCEQMVNEALITKEIIELIGKLKAKNCPVPPISCKCCTDETDPLHAWYNPKSKSITLCSNKLPFEYNINMALWHEMYHAYQYCYDTKKKENPCEQSICEEIEAYYNTTCSGRYEEDKKECVLAHVLTSSNKACNADMKKMKDKFEVLYETCKSDKRIQ